MIPSTLSCAIKEILLLDFTSIFFFISYFNLELLMVWFSNLMFSEGRKITYIFFGHTMIKKGLKWIAKCCNFTILQRNTQDYGTNYLISISCLDLWNLAQAMTGNLLQVPPEILQNHFPVHKIMFQRLTPLFSQIFKKKKNHESYSAFSVDKMITTCIG